MSEILLEEHKEKENKEKEHKENNIKIINIKYIIYINYEYCFKNF